MSTDEFILSNRQKGEKSKKTGRPRGRKSTYTVSEKVLETRRRTSALPVAKNPDEEDYNARLITHIMRIHEIAATADHKDINSLKACFINYLQLCQEDGFSVSNLAAYSAMRFSNEQWIYWSRKDDPEIKEFVSLVKQTCAMFRENLVSDGKLNPVIGIFWQRNFDGLRNDTEQVQAIRDQDNDEYTSRSYKEKYKNLIGE